jgi:hypothetical protein
MKQILVAMLHGGQCAIALRSRRKARAKASSSATRVKRPRAERDRRHSHRCGYFNAGAGIRTTSSSDRYADSRLGHLILCNLDERSSEREPALEFLECVLEVCTARADCP